MAASGTGAQGAGLSSLLHEKLTAGMGLASEIGLDEKRVRDLVSAGAVQTFGMSPIYIWIIFCC